MKRIFYSSVRKGSFGESFKKDDITKLLSQSEKDFWMIILIFGTKLRQNIFNSTKITKMLKNIEILEMTLKNWKRLDYNTRHRTKKVSCEFGHIYRKDP